MRKHRVSGILAVGTAAVLMLSGFDSSITLEELQAQCMDSLAEVTSMSGSVAGAVEGSMMVSGGQGENSTMDIPIAGNLDVDFAFGLEPLQVDASVDMSGEFMGQQMYMEMNVIALEADDGTGVMYMRILDPDNPAGEWKAAAMEAADVAQFKGIIQSSLKGDSSNADTSSLSSNMGIGMGVDMSALAGVGQSLPDQSESGFEIGSNEMDGRQIITLTGSASGAEYAPFIPAALSATGQELDETSLQLVQALVSGLVIDMEAGFEADTCLPIGIYLNLANSDLSELSSVLMTSMMGAESKGSVEISLNTAQLECEFDFTNPVSVTVPQEALDAANQAGVPALSGTGSTGQTGTTEGPIGTNTAGGTDEPTGTVIAGGTDEPTGTVIAGGTDAPTETGSDDDTSHQIGSFLTGGTGAGTETGTDTTDTTVDKPTGTDTTDTGSDQEAVMNEDGSYHLELDNGSGVVKTADVDAPAGMNLNYGAPAYLSFLKDGEADYLTISLYSLNTEGETVKDKMAVGYKTEELGYSNVQTTDLKQAMLDDGRVVCYATVTFTRDDWNQGTTVAAVRSGNAVVSLELVYFAENGDFREATEEEVLDACSLVHVS